MSLFLPIEKATVSIPPGSGRKKGARYGYMGKSRLKAEPDVVIECKPEVCPDCGADLRDVKQKVVGRSQVVEIPPIQPVVIEAQRYGCVCPVCGKEQSADYPDVMEPERDSLFVFLHIPGVSCDNNASERALRNSVIHRKVSGGFRSDARTEAHAVVSSVFDTARKHWSSDAIAKGQSGEDVFETLQSHIGSPAPVGG